MRWLFKNLIAEQLMFPCCFLWLQALAWAIRRWRPRVSKVLAVFAFAGLVIFSGTAVPVRLLERVETEMPALDLRDPKLAERADAIVILGGGRTLGAQEYGGKDVVSPTGFLRLRYGVDLQHRTGKLILTSGGKPGGPGETEAVLMGEALKEDFGTEAKWMERKSNNTGENARYSFEILAPLGIRRIFLVTNAAHMGRAVRSFEKAGFQVVAAPMGYLSDAGGDESILSWIPSASGVKMSSIYFHEEIGVIWYALTGA